MFRRPTSLALRARQVAMACLAAGAAALAPGVWGQSTGAQAVFEGRPAMAGAQGGIGAMAGLPQGGIGLQGNEGARLPGLVLRPPSSFLQNGTRLEAPPSVSSPTNVMAAATAAPTGAELSPQRDRDSGVAKRPRSASDKVQRAARRTREAARYGVSPVDAR